jgi:hypothetical protein
MGSISGLSLGQKYRNAFGHLTIPRAVRRTSVFREGPVWMRATPSVPGIIFPEMFPKDRQVPVSL